MSVAANGWGGRLLLADGFVAYRGAGSHAEEHAHYAVQLVWGLGRDVVVTTAGETHSVGASLIPSEVPHSLSATAEPLLVLLVEPNGPRGRLLNTIAVQHVDLDLERHLNSIAMLALTSDVGAMRLWCEQIIDTVIASAQRDLPVPGAPRREVLDALAYIDDTLPDVPRLTVAASRVGVSASRLTHLFTTQVGIPFRRFVLWARIRLVTEQVQAGRNLTDAAASAGFADSAHFTRVFRAMFGLAPSTILPHLEVVGQFSER